ncbi:site-specific recombinase [Methanomicrobium sp. W14]|jgi:hypothetical protein|uniref:hypothetical protein n=1 Tax=Methanomicrobium sp. W14 TaxID=2817839 RepID=UPI001AE57157|nr:hypothetical protein [Methanomicrobium sp. W14]MBP2132995.1 site-specific recombinase [Methanomicrobium sp. W14]
MADKFENNPLRVAAALILGVVTGVIGFFIVALVLGMIEDMSGFSFGISLDIADNILSAIVLVIFIIAGLLFFYWKVSTVPPSKENTDSD